jgi:glyoxylate/hydroxypyruvate reductase
VATAGPVLLVLADERWQAAFAAALPELEVVGQSPSDPSRVGFVAGWNPPPGRLRALPGLRAVFALGAGVDGFLARDDLPRSVPLVKLDDAGMAEQMTDYVLAGVLDWQRRLTAYALQQQRGHWRPLPGRARAEVRIGVLGLGHIGGRVAAALAACGYPVRGFSRTSRMIAGVSCESGEAALAGLLGGSDVLVNLLPSTPHTRGLLDRDRLSCLPRGALVINAARGDQLDSGALVSLLDDGWLEAAWLDVFASEPLPADSPLWRHPRVRITPHVAALTPIAPAVEQIAANLRRLLAGEPMRCMVDRVRGY